MGVWKELGEKHVTGKITCCSHIRDIDSKDMMNVKETKRGIVHWKVKQQQQQQQLKLNVGLLGMGIAGRVGGLGSESYWIFGVLMLLLGIVKCRQWIGS